MIYIILTQRKRTLEEINWDYSAENVQIGLCFNDPDMPTYRRKEICMSKFFNLTLYFVFPMLCLGLPLLFKIKGIFDFPYETNFWKLCLLIFDVIFIFGMTIIISVLYRLMNKGHKYELTRIKDNMLGIYY